mmetsp:Transcript_23261/g.49110  ORF Transcript_23261/g.49110 Transcript_23261/m.49110 type:complete len:432 (+) Transcript_23261:83-1378(+)
MCGGIITPSTTVGVDSSNDNDAKSTPRLYTLYFIRHAEALHNQLEKEAQSSALSLAISQGHDPNSQHAKQVQEEARKAVLEKDTIRDPPLSSLGLEEARRAKRTLEQLVSTYNLPEVQEVWVSPLQRTLQTAATIFPESRRSNSVDSEAYTSAQQPALSSNDANSNNKASPVIRVKKELEERQTGFACDMHSSFRSLRKRNTFRRFSLSCLKLNALSLNASERFDSSTSTAEEVSNTNGDTLWEETAVHSTDADGSIAPTSRKDSANNVQTININRRNMLQKSHPSTATTSSNSSSTTAAIEDKSMLRERTKKLFHLLAETSSQSICLIGHKGYLRKLERGPLGHDDAALFQNCEVRVYRLQLDVTVDNDDDQEAVVDCLGCHYENGVLEVERDDNMVGYDFDRSSSRPSECSGGGGSNDFATVERSLPVL